MITNRVRSGRVDLDQIESSPVGIRHCGLTGANLDACFLNKILILLPIVYCTKVVIKRSFYNLLQ